MEIHEGEVIVSDWLDNVEYRKWKYGSCICVHNNVGDVLTSFHDAVKGYFDRYLNGLNTSYIDYYISKDFKIFDENNKQIEIEDIEKTLFYHKVKVAVIFEKGTLYDRKRWFIHQMQIGPLKDNYVEKHFDVCLF